MSRKAEFLAVVKTIVDKDSNKKVKQSTIELAQELSDVLNEINVKPDTDDFKELKDVFNEQLAEMGKQPIVFSENTLRGIASQFANAISDGIKAGMAEGNSEIKSLLKERTDLEDAYNNRNKNGRGSKTKVKTKLAKDIRAAFDYEPAEKAIGIGANLKSIKNEYDAATDWEHQYIALLKYIKAYKALENISKDKSTLEKWGNIGGYSIDQLKRSEAAIQSSLQNIFNIAYDKPLIGLTQDGTIDVNVELKLIKTLDAYDVTGGEGSIKVEVEPVIKKSKKNSTPNAFRGVHRPDTSEGKSYSRDFLGGEFWTDRSGKDFFMQSYGFESGDDGAANLSAVFRPLNELYVDAFSGNESLQFHQIDKIKLLQYLFPGIEKFLNVANPGGRDNVQKFYNEMARQAGFDLFKVINVDEGGDELATTLVPLQERIIEYASKIPEYYDVTKFTPEIERVIISQQKGTSERWYDETISRLKSELNKAIQDEDVNKINDLKEIIPQLQSMRQAAMDAFDKAIVSYGGYIEDEVKRGLPQVIKTTDNGELIGTISEGSLKNLLEEYGELNQKAANWDDNSGTDKEFKALNDRMKEIKENLLFSLSNDLKDEAYEILTDFEFGDKTLDETYQYFKPKLSYSDNLSEQPIEPLRKTADETEREQKANEVAAKAAQEKAKADNDAAEAAKKAADEAEREKSAKEETAKAEREAADTRRTELVSQLDKYVEDNRNAGQAYFNLGEREKIYQTLIDEGLLTDEIKEKYAEVNKRLEARLALLKQVEEHEHNIDGIPGSGLLTSEQDPKVYYEEWFKPFQNDVENIRASNLFSTEEIEHYNIKLAQMQDYLQSIANEALNNYIINPDEIDDTQKLNEILTKRKEILATVVQFDTPLDSSSTYNEALELNKAIEDRISLLQQSHVGATEDSEIAVNQKKIESYEELCEVAERYNKLIFKGSSKTDDEHEELDALRERIYATKGERTTDQMIDDTMEWSRMVGPMGELPVKKLARYLGIEIPQAARVAEGAVGNLNSELREGQSLMSQTPGSSALTGTGGASSEELKSLQDKNDQLRQEKENAEKDKNAANERANKAEAETERLRNELANRDKVDSDKSPSGATPIDTSELESLLGRVTYKVKFEGESPLDNSAAVLETVKSALSNIQINASADKDAPWAREATLNGVIKNLLESIKSNTNSINEALKNVSIGPKSESKENDNIVVAKDSKNTKNKHGSISHGKADGESNSPQKILDYYYWLEEQMEQFKNNTMYFNALKETYDSITPKINKLIEEVLTEAEEKYGPDKNPPWLDSLIEKHGLHMAKIKGGEEYSDSISKEKKALDILSEEYRLKSEIFNLEQKGATQNDLAPLYEKLGIYESIRSAIENSMDDGELTRYSVQAANVQNKGENKLTAAEIKANIKTRAEEAKKAAQSVKEEAAAVQELDELYQQLAQAKAMADAASDSVLRKPFEDRVSRLQSEIDAKEANIDRTKYSQQFDDTQKESYKKQIVEELIELYTKLGEAEAKEDRMSIGNATAQQNKSEMDALYKRIEATQKLIDVNEELQNQFDAARKAASDKVVAKANKADAVSDDKSFEKLGKQYEKLGKLRAQAQSTGSAVTQEDARQLEEVIKKEQERLSLSKEQTEELKRRLEVARQNELLRQNSIKQQKSFEQQIKDSRNKARLNTVNSTVRTSQDVLNNAMTIEGLSPESINRIKELSIEVNKLQNKYTEINDKGGVVSDEDQKDVVNQIANVKKLSSEVNGLVKEYNNMSGDNAKTIGKFNGQLNGAFIDEYERQLTEAVMAATNGKASIKGFDAETKTLTYSLKTGSHEFTNYTAAVRGADKTLVSVQKETKRTETFVESLTRKTKEIGTYLISSLSLYDVVNKFRQGIQYVREIDSALVELRKVTDETEESYDRFLQTASKTGAKIGSTISDYTRATATFAKLGYSIDMASEMAEAAIIYQNVGDGIESADAAAESIISTMKGFGLQASDAMSIVDKFNQVGNEFSITSKGIGDALQRSASALSEGNNTLDESIGLITAANSVVQDPETVGKAMCRR